jgi:ribosome biogenesis GTPase
VRTGIVVKTTGSWHTVKINNIRLQCRLKGAFRNQSMKNTNPVAVGDLVEIEDGGDNTGIITRIEKRKNYIIRKSIKLSRETQIMAANIDQAMLMFTLDFPETPLEFVDRFLVGAEAYHIPVILIINKTDLYSREKAEHMPEVIDIYQYAGYKVIPISVIQGTNMDQVSESLTGKITLVAGNSGTGKTSMINYLCPGLNLKTNDISWYHQAGKHTTTYPEMIEINDTSFIIDSPGIRGFGITDLQKNEIGLYFTDIFRISRNCQFYNCSHIHEPGCAVIEAVEKGILHESRYRSYFNIYTDTDEKYRNG